MLDFVPSLINALRMIYTISNYYNTSEKMTYLLIKVRLAAAVGPSLSFTGFTNVMWKIFSDRPTCQKDTNDYSGRLRGTVDYGVFCNSVNLR
jgi:hypothetical protein